MRGRDEAGFTVLELAVTMLLLTVALAISAGLLVEAVRVYSATGRELREPASELTFRLLRDDVRTSSPLAGGSGLTGDPLVLERDSGLLLWAVQGDRLERRTVDADGNDLGSRPMLDKIIAFRWAADRGKVSIVIVRRRPENASALRAATSAWRDHGEIFETASLVIGSRIDFVPESE